MRILYIEDIPMLAAVYQLLLNQDFPDPDRELVHVSTFAEAKRRLKKRSFDLIIADFGFPGPGKSGYIPPFTGGINLLRWVVEKRILAEYGGKSAFCFLSAKEDFEIIEALENKKVKIPKGLRIYRRGVTLHEIIEDFKKGRLNAAAPTRPEKKTAEEKNSSAVKKEYQP